jgi:hypothetical protein
LHRVLRAGIDFPEPCIVFRGPGNAFLDLETHSKLPCIAFTKPCIAFATPKHRSATLVLRSASPGNGAASIGRAAASMELNPASK